jgi:magnesium chelatase family protein
VFLIVHRKPMSAAVQSIIITGFNGTVIDVQCGLSNNLPTIVIVGYGNKAVNEAKERIRGAFADSQLQLPRKRITINLAPAGLPKSDSSFDLAIAASILIASQQVPAPAPGRHHQAFIGELGLDGSVRAVRGIIGKLLAGRAAGLTTFYIPFDNLAQARLVPGVQLYGIKKLGELYRHLNGTELIPAVNRHQASQTALSRPIAGPC